jgi:hypothetical protein
MPTMVFRRDIHADAGCLEYSWVPEGVRHVMLLREDQEEGSQTDSVFDATEISHVQVYRLLNDGVGVQNWQFPPGPPYAAPVAIALVQVLRVTMEVIGTVVYVDGTCVRDVYKLEMSPVTCPEPRF